MGILSLFTGGKRDRLIASALEPAPLLPATWVDPAPLTRLTIADLYGLELARLPWITRSTALGIAAVAKGRHVITKIAAFPLVDMSGHHPTARPAAWLQQPEAGRPSIQTLQWTVDGLLFYGRAWWIVTDRYADGMPRRFKLVPEHRAEVDHNGRMVRAYGEPVSPGDVIRIDGPHEGLLNTAQDNLRQAVAIEAAAARAADNPVPSVELHQTNEAELSDEEIDNLIDGWAAARRGANGGVAYTSNAVEARVHGAAAEQLLIAGRNTAALNIARAMGLSAWAVDAGWDGTGASMSYQSVPARSRELIEYGLAPYMDAITGRLSMDDVLPAGRWCRFDTSTMTRGTFKERMDGYAAAIAAGIYTAEECRELENGIPQEGRP